MIISSLGSLFNFLDTLFFLKINIIIPFYVP